MEFLLSDDENGIGYGPFSTVAIARNYAYDNRVTGHIDKSQNKFNRFSIVHYVDGMIHVDYTTSNIASHSQDVK